MTGSKELRLRLIQVMGGRCEECGVTVDPATCSIDHVAFPDVKLGSQSPVRDEELREFARTNRRIPGTRLLCDRCNRKRHKWRPSNKELFGENP
jgi:hypothetical protein